MCWHAGPAAEECGHSWFLQHSMLPGDPAPTHTHTHTHTHTAVFLQLAPDIKQGVHQNGSDSTLETVPVLPCRPPEHATFRRGWWAQRPWRDRDSTVLVLKKHTQTSKVSLQLQEREEGASSACRPPFIKSCSTSLSEQPGQAPLRERVVS